jgi:hypothetical protein
MQLSDPISKEHVSRLKKLFETIEDNPSSYEFREPVPWKDLGLNDYPEIIKRPMDLSTCRKSLVKSKYKNYSEFFSDLQLIWDNCKTYNIAGSEIYILAETMEKFCKKLVRDVKEELGFSSDAAKRKKEKEPREGKKGKESDEEEEEEVTFE